MTEREYLRIPEVVSFPDKVERGGKTKTNNLNTLVYSKSFEDGTTIIVEEIRTGRKKLKLQSAYKRKVTPIRHDSEESPALRPERPGSTFLKAVYRIRVF